MALGCRVFVCRALGFCIFVFFFFFLGGGGGVQESKIRLRECPKLPGLWGVGFGV